MASEIPFVRDLTFGYGKVDQVTPLIRRVIAENPGPFTFHGTGTYIVGHGNVAVIDPGPLVDNHVDALLAAVANELFGCKLGLVCCKVHLRNDQQPWLRVQ